MTKYQSCNRSKIMESPPPHKQHDQSHNWRPTDGRVGNYGKHRRALGKLPTSSGNNRTDTTQRIPLLKYEILKLLT